MTTEIGKRQDEDIEPGTDGARVWFTSVIAVQAQRHEQRTERDALCVGTPCVHCLRLVPRPDWNAQDGHCLRCAYYRAHYPHWYEQARRHR